MVDEDRYCFDVLVQTAAGRRALGGRGSRQPLYGRSVPIWRRRRIALSVSRAGRSAGNGPPLFHAGW
ncbi:metal-sensing transcriptional repressor [Sulfitobacter sp. 916]|uniref:metal-sensing transcriptional repressor n=1 Tax=Rhodobacterales TaxID=204455 RepID=UPI0034E065E8